MNRRTRNTNLEILSDHDGTGTNAGNGRHFIPDLDYETPACNDEVSTNRITDDVFCFGDDENENGEKEATLRIRKIFDGAKLPDKGKNRRARKKKTDCVEKNKAEIQSKKGQSEDEDDDNPRPKKRKHAKNSKQKVKGIQTRAMKRTISNISAIDDYEFDEFDLSGRKGAHIEDDDGNSSLEENGGQSRNSLFEHDSGEIQQTQSQYYPTLQIFPSLNESDQSRASSVISLDFNKPMEKEAVLNAQVINAGTNVQRGKDMLLDKNAVTDAQQDELLETNVLPNKYYLENLLVSGQKFITLSMRVHAIDDILCYSGKRLIKVMLHNGHENGGIFDEMLEWMDSEQLGRNVGRPRRLASKLKTLEVNKIYTFFNLRVCPVKSHFAYLNRGTIKEQEKAYTLCYSDRSSFEKGVSSRNSRCCYSNNSSFVHGGIFSPKPRCDCHVTDDDELFDNYDDYCEEMCFSPSNDNLLTESAADQNDSFIECNEEHNDAIIESDEEQNDAIIESDEEQNDAIIQRYANQNEYDTNDPFINDNGEDEDDSENDFFGDDYFEDMERGIRAYRPEEVDSDEGDDEILDFSKYSDSSSSSDDQRSRSPSTERDPVKESAFRKKVTEICKRIPQIVPESLNLIKGHYAKKQQQKLLQRSFEEQEEESDSDSSSVEINFADESDPDWGPDESPKTKRPKVAIESDDDEPSMDIVQNEPEAENDFDSNMPCSSASIKHDNDETHKKPAKGRYNLRSRDGLRYRSEKDKPITNERHFIEGGEYERLQDESYGSYLQLLPEKERRQRLQQIARQKFLKEEYCHRKYFW